jgi:hypothetical protein
MLDVRKLTALLIVEPDPETWLPTEQAIGQAGLLLDELNQAFAAQVDLYPRLWPGTANDDEGLFGAEGRFTPVHPHSTVPVTDDSDLWIFLRELLIGIARRQPQTVFGLLGAMREDEIQRVAEAVAGCGLRAVVLEPLCLSLALFRDVDALVADADRQQGARRVLTGEDYSPLDDGLENGEEPETGDDDRLE